MRRLLLSLLLTLLAVPAIARADLVSDGTRYAAWERHGVVHVLDDHGPAQTIPVPVGCRLANIGAGKLLFDCSVPSDDAILVRGQTVDIATGAVAQLPERVVGESGAPVDSAGYGAIGTHWIAYGASYYHGSITTYLPLDGGPPQSIGSNDVFREAQRSVLDLDTPQLEVPMCAPLRIRGGEAIDAPYGVYRRPYLAVQWADGRLTLQRCGSPTAKVVTRCPGFCGNIALGRGLLAWIDGRSWVHLRRHRGASVVWRPRSGARWLVLTDRRAVVQTRGGAIVTRRVP
jgi:hypothetical protein